jgi:hypothetical protein
VFDAFQEGIAVHPEIMFPLVCSDHEIEIIAPVVKNAVSSTVVALGKGSGFSFTYKIGTMLEGENDICICTCVHIYRDKYTCISMYMNMNIYIQVDLDLIGTMLEVKNKMICMLFI